MRIRKRWPPPTPTVMSSDHHHHQFQKDDGHVKAPPTHKLHLQDSSNGPRQGYVVNGETASVVNQRTGSRRSPESSTRGSTSSPASRQGQWCKEELDFPPKKRRVSLTSSNTRLMVGEGKKMDLSDRKSSKNKNKTWDDDEEEKDGEKKEREIGGNIMEKSWQCSRSNGRGWRCSQAARVGYSMCEHHYWRDRQMTRRSKATGVNNGKKVKTSSSYLVEYNKVNANYGQCCKEELDFPLKTRRVSLTSSNTRFWEEEDERDGRRPKGS